MRGDHPGFRIFILGAGFSKLAGLPLGRDLYSLVVENITSDSGIRRFNRDLKLFLEYKNSYFETKVDESSFNFEEFLQFLDFEHFLLLKGKDTWSDQGNETQLMIRHAIGEVIHRSMPHVDDIPDAYFKFVDYLRPTDWVITLNYDILLERCFEIRNKAFRLFPHRDSESGAATKEEVVILKLHGSIDWFDAREFLSMAAHLKSLGLPKSKHDEIFSDPARYGVKRIVDDPKQVDDSFSHICRIKSVDSFYARGASYKAPFLLSPSHAKFLYSDPLKDFWYQIGSAGGFNRGLAIIGYSLPDHDEYMRMWLFRLILNYQELDWDDDFIGGIRKDNVKFVDFQNNEDGVIAYKKRYSFINGLKSSFYFSGFDNEAVEFLFKPQR